MKVTKSVTVELDSIRVAQNIAIQRGLRPEKHPRIIGEWIDKQARIAANRNPKLLSDVPETQAA